MKKLIAFIMVLMLSLGMAWTIPAESENEAEQWEDVFAEWNPEAPALEALIDYVESVTDEESEDFIPVSDRIAVFDMDGTLYAELCPTYLVYYVLAWRILKDPDCHPDEELLAFGRELRDSVIRGSFAEGFSGRYLRNEARAYAGMTLREFSDFVTQILLQDADGFEGMTYGEAFYLPMLEVVEYLQDNDFTVYVCSGSDRFLCRTLLEGVLDIPPANIIGSDVALEATNQNGANGQSYVFTAEDDIHRTDQQVVNNLRMNKVGQIVQEIGMQPVISFGNSSGDVSMHNYTIHNNPYKSIAFMLIADDEERDYGNTERARELGEQWEEYGFQVISMRDDFQTIYGDDVVKTGSFRWPEKLAD